MKRDLVCERRTMRLPSRVGTGFRLYLLKGCMAAYSTCPSLAFSTFSHRERLGSQRARTAPAPSKNTQNMIHKRGEGIQVKTKVYPKEQKSQELKKANPTRNFR